MYQQVPACVGLQHHVTTLSGNTVRYVNLDNTATTPPFVDVLDAVNDFLGWYGSIHRGSGYKSFFSTWIFEQARKRIFEFVGADTGYHELIFTSNTTAAINKAARVMSLSKDDIVLVSQIEHSSNDLPWRQRSTVIRYDVNKDTTINKESIRNLLIKLHGRVKLVSVTGASNVTGYIPPYHEIAELSHSFNVPIFVDCAQLIPHKKIMMGMQNDPRHLDYIAFSAHKMGAPFGTGVLIGPSEVFQPRDVPSDEPGGGTTDILTDEKPFWTTSPDRFESGTPNAVGAIALAKAVEVLSAFGMDNVEKNEAILWEYAVGKLTKIPKVKLYINPAESIDHTPIIPFNIEGYPHGLVAAILGFEYGIGVRHGRHCADSLVLYLLGLSKDEQKRVVKQVVDRGRKTDIYGVVRPSIGLCNIKEDIDRLIESVSKIVKDGTKYKYQPEYNKTMVAGRITQQTGEYRPEGFSLEQLLKTGKPPNSLMSLSRTYNK
ncbi:MAG: aminotransferase class V-fold PLP-dependent enzyme [Candidatus Brocadiaceae bacterium]|nr:aminotransferase class V-fold PLP-dependent enzyme [Candidatus Brocadiaceae bacterium]